MNVCLKYKCIRCCLQTNMLLSEKDIDKICSLGMKREKFITRKNGWLMLKNKKGRCVFHNGKYCTIYNHRPEGCQLYPLIYNKDFHQVLFDKDCPHPNWFTLTEEKKQQLFSLIDTLFIERKNRV